MCNGHYLSERLMKSGIHVSVTISVVFHTATCDNARDKRPAISQLAYSAYCAMGVHCIRVESELYWRTLLSHSINCLLCMYLCYRETSGTFRIQVTSQDIATAFVDSASQVRSSSNGNNRIGLFSLQHFVAIVLIQESFML